MTTIEDPFTRDRHQLRTAHPPFPDGPELRVIMKKIERGHALAGSDKIESIVILSLLAAFSGPGAGSVTQPKHDVRRASEVCVHQEMDTLDSTRQVRTLAAGG